jgi:hypothetical protein
VLLPYPAGAEISVTMRWCHSLSRSNKRARGRMSGATRGRCSLVRRTPQASTRPSSRISCFDLLAILPFQSLTVSALPAVPPAFMPKTTEILACIHSPVTLPGNYNRQLVLIGYPPQDYLSSPLFAQLLAGHPAHRIQPGLTSRISNEELWDSATLSASLDNGS